MRPGTAGPRKQALQALCWAGSAWPPQSAPAAELSSQIWVSGASAGKFAGRLSLAVGGADPLIEQCIAAQCCTALFA